MSSGPNDNAKDLNDLVTNRMNQVLLKHCSSPNFSIYNCIELLCKHADNIGIHFYLCQKLLTFPHSELQFYIPQLVQVLLTVETESMALEELILELKNENPHFALLTFWQLQALLADLSTDPKSYGFQVARRVLNNLHSSLFNTATADDENKIKRINENVGPGLLLASMVMSSIALPQLGGMTRPLVDSQGKRQKAFVFKLAKNAMKDLRKNITLKNTILNTKNTHVPSRNKDLELPESPVDLIDSTKTREDALFKKPKHLETDLNFDIVDDVGEQLFQDRISNSIKLPKRRSKYLDDSYVHRTYESVSLSSSPRQSISSMIQRPTYGSAVYEESLLNVDQFTSSMPDLHDVQPSRSRTSLSFSEKKSDDTRSNSQPPSLADGFVKLSAVTSDLDRIQDMDVSQMTTKMKIKILKANYFRCETQFAIALESISQRLAQVPTEARFSALRAELSLLNSDLPAEVDIPTLLPPNRKGKLHRLVLITANEAQVLNSAEKVPYLLLIEYLRDDFDFDPTSEENQEILRRKPNAKSFIFDLNDISRIKNRGSEFELESTILTSTSESNTVASRPASPLINNFTFQEPAKKGGKEMDLGDMSMIRVKNQTDAEAYRESLVLQSATKIPVIPRDSEQRAPELSFVATLEDAIVPRAETRNFQDKTVELANEMRISAVMLAQLDKSPQEISDTANQIRAKIIASMKEVQDKFGYRDLEAIHGTAGERKLENDLKTGGIDTSYLGEDWITKKERIRKTSEYGHLENWDLCSVIAKCGDDLRQEAFACQIIQAMAQIWTKEKVDVWVKKMKILITSANTGLVETITNAISVHSIKKSLTKKMIEDGNLDEKGVIASLNDHFIRAFGDTKSFKYKRAQDNFASSLAAYSVICYLLQIKDRHNGNIMVDNEGHLVHIDFGFMLSNSPGSVGFEAAPFKLTYEYAELLGGLQGEPYRKFVMLVKDAYKALRKHAEQIVSMCEIMQKDNMQPCFNAGGETSVQLKQRFHLELSDTECDEFVENYLVGKSLGSIYTRLYDQFQLTTQGIYS
ncbi:hypothetical protein HG535_0A01030 [Zygotorulaspora mrakii]|uniref:1-phosphatidylinositol 4-kinase n=1 Tax=Zygotorulaspora mrakii TaxID=42260 RepID=A0A7H9AVT9_ZYGMR|nr:uncharacterized protein HG535_0A01030 [Zygotorulaspora mrakii]QLG70164.1 hypothetical protein HG535_0A01030 [Zygotorulaspora mrakii]